MLDRLQALEEAGWQALARGEGAAFYDKMMTEDAIMVVPGMVLTRDAVLASFKDVPPWATYQLDDEQVIQLSDDTALITYQATARREGAQTPYTAQMTSVYVFRDGAWRLALHQQTPPPND